MPPTTGPMNAVHVPSFMRWLLLILIVALAGCAADEGGTGDEGDENKTGDGSGNTNGGVGEDEPDADGDPTRPEYGESILMEDERDFSGSIDAQTTTCDTTVTLQFDWEGDGELTLRLEDGNGTQIEEWIVQDPQGSKRDTQIEGAAGEWTLHLDAPETPAPPTQALAGYHGSYRVECLC